MNSRLKAILVDLSLHVRVLSIDQVARFWWPDCLRAKSLAKRAIVQAEKSGWVRVRNVISRATCPLAQPLLTWDPQNPNPDLAGLSKKLRKRAKRPLSQTLAVTATTRSRQLFGGVGHERYPKLTQIWHDLFVAEVLQHYRSVRNDVDANWIGEDRLPANWPIRTRPDAVLRSLDCKTATAIEFGGAYTLARLERFHNDMAKISLPYEVW